MQTYTHKPRGGPCSTASAYIIRRAILEIATYINIVFFNGLINWLVYIERLRSPPGVSVPDLQCWGSYSKAWIDVSRKNFDNPPLLYPATI